MRPVRGRWFIDDMGWYWLRCDDGSYRFFGHPHDEDEVLRKVREGKLAFEATPVTEIDGFKIYHVYTTDSLPIAHFDLLVIPKTE